MERLTDVINGVAVYVGPGRELVGGSLPIEMSTQQVRTVLGRLAAYEDTGLTPERCAELAEADKEGRLAVLPCKTGDMVYIHKFPTITDLDGTQYYLCDRRKMTVEPIKFSLIMLELKTGFWLTREEAEHALKEAKGDG